MEFSSLVGPLSEALGGVEAERDRIIKLFLPMETEHAEVVATVYAAWNDLLLDGKNPTDEAIVSEARENWSEERNFSKVSNGYKEKIWRRAVGGSTP
jgi:hypothetical protein